MFCASQSSPSISQLFLGTSSFASTTCSTMARNCSEQFRLMLVRDGRPNLERMGGAPNRALSSSATGGSSSWSRCGASRRCFTVTSGIHKIRYRHPSLMFNSILKKTMENKQLLPSLAIFWGKGIITHSLSYFWIKRACLYTKISGQSSPKLQTPSQAVPWIK